MLYSIISITGDADAIIILVGSLGANAKASKENQKNYLDNIAQDTVQQYVQIRSSSKSNGCTYNSGDTAATTTYSLTQLSSSESNCINNGDITTTVSCHVVCQAPPVITTINIENSVGSIDDSISPLAMQLGTPSKSKFDFESFFGEGNDDGMGFGSSYPSNDTQHISRNCDEDSDNNSNGMPFDSFSTKTKRS